MTTAEIEKEIEELKEARRLQGGLFDIIIMSIKEMEKEIEELKSKLNKED